MVNDFFLGLTDQFTPLEPPSWAPQEVPPEFLVSESEVLKALQAVKTRKAVGPDLIPNRVLKEFAPELAAVVRDIYNSSLVEGYFPDSLKVAILNPIPKISPPQQIEKDLRPIALTCALAKVMEGFTRVRLISQVANKIDPRQYACVGRSTTDALVYLLQAVYEAVDTGNSGARLFMADFSKGFDMIDHEVLIKELEKLDVHPVLVNWIKAFLSNRTQAVRIGNTVSDWKTPKGGIPQGTKLGVILFSIMTNSLLRAWNLRIKFVDDTTALEIIPRNSVSLLNFAANDIFEFSNEHKMKLNPSKCNEMLINFMSNHNFVINPIILGNNVIERTSTYKLLGVYISSDLKWDYHTDYIVKKANKRLFSLRILKQCGATPVALAKVFVTIVRPILEYAAPVWQNIPDFLDNNIERVQKRAMFIICPSLDYKEALRLLGLTSLRERRQHLCRQYVSKLQDVNSPLHFLLPRREEIVHNYDLRSGTSRSTIKSCRTKRSQDFVTSRY